MGRRKNPAASVPEPRAAFLKEWEGEAERLLAPSVHVFCIPALVFTQSEAGALGVRMKGRGGAFLGAMLRGAAVCAEDNFVPYLSVCVNADQLHEWMASVAFKLAHSLVYRL